jgi:hypothetical protein
VYNTADPTEELDEPHLVSASKSFGTEIILTTYPYNSSHLSAFADKTTHPFHP